MRGYGGIDMAISACVHFVRGDEVDEGLEPLVQHLKQREVTIGYMSYGSGSNDLSAVINELGQSLALTGAPYSSQRPLLRFIDDLIALSRRASGLVIVIDNAGTFLRSDPYGLFDLTEAFLVQFDDWFLAKKPCHLCFQLEPCDLVKKVFT